MQAEKKSAALTIGWVLLLVLGALVTLGAFESLYISYWGFGDAPAGVQLSDLAKVNPELPAALRGRRATAASLAVTCGVLLMWIAVSAFRKAQKWSWYALLCAFGIGGALSLLRVTALGIRAGTAGPAIVLLVLIVALVVSYRDFRA
jgi:hypothetical protein